jgi:lysophospholipase L1-like esterase
MRRRSPAVEAAALMVAMLLGGIPAAHAGPTTKVTYLALGTSLSVGFQPGKGLTDVGYVDDLWRATEPQLPGLMLRNVGCIGETTRSMINGNHSLCDYTAGSQLDAAVAFLKAHPGEVAFMTIDVGANDLAGACLRDSWRLDRACATDLFPRLQARVTKIIAALQAAAPDVPIVAMNYYDPLLGLWGLVPGGRALARANQRVWSSFNDTLAAAYGASGVAVADVAATFRIDDFTDTLVVPGRGPLPANVAITCRWTWFCTPRFAGNIHTNKLGYRKIADTFALVLDPLLP